MQKYVTKVHGMKKQLEQYFGCEVKIEECGSKLSLPIFMTMRKIKLVELLGVRFAMVDVMKESELTVAAMKKQQKKYEAVLQCPVAYEIATNSVAMRNALIKNGISFIDLPGNVFLPFLGIVLQDVYQKQRIKADKMMPATQMVFLKLFYMKDEQSILKSKVASELNLTKTSITRATAQLEEMGLIEQNKSGTEISIRRNLPRGEYYEKAKDYLINPVQKVVTIMYPEPKWNMWCAGETALSRLSELNPPRIEEMAIYKGDEIVDQFELADERVVDPRSLIKVQLWKYNPAYFAGGSSFSTRGCVDAISLACSFKGNADERIERSIDELMEWYRW